MKPNPNKFKGKNNSHRAKSHSLKPFTSYQKNLLEKITNFQVGNNQNQTRTIIPANLHGSTKNKCLYGKNCAHLRIQSKCFFLHQQRDYEALSIPLPDTFLQNEEPLKKSKQQRKQDKIRQKAERQKRLNEKLQRQNKNEKQKQQQNQNQQEPLKRNKKTQPKVMDQRQLLIQQIFKSQNKQITIGYIYEQLNHITDAFVYQVANSYSEKFDLKSMQMSMFQVRKRLLMKLKKNKEYENLQKQFLEKEGGFIKKIFKNIYNSSTDLIEQIQSLSKLENLDLRQIQQVLSSDDIDKILNSKKENQHIIEYYSRFFKCEYGFPISFQVSEDEEKAVTINKGNLLSLTNYHILAIICPNFDFRRTFITSNITFTQLRAFSQFSSLLIPQKISQKSPIQKTFAINLAEISYNKLIDQITTEYTLQYHQKMKGLTKQFELGKTEQNLKKYRTFLAKYKAKVQTENKQNSFVLVVYNISILLENIERLNLRQNMSYDSIKQDRIIEQESVYQRIFLLRQFINIMGQKETNLKVVYVNQGKKFKPQKYSTILGSIDKGLIFPQKTKMQQQK